jgi:hypothetical protein
MVFCFPSVVSAQAEAPWLIMDGPSPGYIEVPHDPALNPESITIEAWVYLPSGLTYRGGDCPSIAGKSYVDSWWLAVCGKKLSFYSHGSGSRNQSTSEIPTGEWVHVAVTSDATHHRFYFNGSLDGEFSHDLGPMPANTKPMRIGSDPSYNVRPHGAIDEVRIWNVARSEGEIAAMMNTPITSSMTGLVAVWNLDGDATDSVGGFDGTLIGDTVFGDTVPEANECMQEYFLTSAAHTDGALGSKWFTDLILFNPNGGANPVKLYLLPQNTDNSNPLRVDVSVEPFTAVALQDVVFEEFGVDDMSAAMRICSDQTLLIDSRTFNAPAKSGATFGQGVPAVKETVASRYTRRIIGLFENDQFRTNIGIVNASPEPTTVTVRMYTQDRVWIGDKEFQLPPYGYKQRSRIFKRVTDDIVDNGYIEVWSDGSPILVFASVVDNVSGDGTYKLAR